MKRREFITALGGMAAGAWPFAARAQRFSNLTTIGFLGEGTRSSHGPLFAAFVQRLRELGWVEGHTVAIELRWGEGRNERFAEFAAEFNACEHRSKPSNQSLQLTAGRSDASHQFMKTPPFQSALAPASGS